MKLKFDKNRKRVKRCPCCGHLNKGGYVPFIGTENGYCNYCGSTCIAEKTINITNSYKLFQSPSEEINLLPELMIQQSFKNHEQIDFVRFVLKKFGLKLTKDIISKYYLCRSNKIKNAVVFWQIDQNNKIRTGKIMCYNPNTGKRIGYPSWVHSFKDKYNLKQCFFGEHLIQKNKPIAIVESEKAACILSVCNPYFTWIASGGSNGLNRSKCSALKGHSVTLFPDQGKYIEWERRSSEIGLKCSISVEAEKWYNEGYIKKGEAIDDYYLNLLQVSGKHDTEWNQKEYDQIFKLNSRINYNLT